MKVKWGLLLVGSFLLVRVTDGAKSRVRDFGLPRGYAPRGPFMMRVPLSHPHYPWR